MMPKAIPTGQSISKLSVSEHSLKRIATAMELILNQQEQQTALIATIAEMSRILVDAVEQAAVWSTLDEEQ